MEAARLRHSEAKAAERTAAVQDALRDFCDIMHRRAVPVSRDYYVRKTGAKTRWASRNFWFVGIVSVRRGAVKPNRVIFCVGIDEAEDAVGVGGVGADGGPIGSAEICRRLNQARLVGGTVAGKLEGATGQDTTNENSTRFGGAYQGQCAGADSLVGAAAIVSDYAETVAARGQ